MMRLVKIKDRFIQLQFKTVFEQQIIFFSSGDYNNNIRYDDVMCAQTYCFDVHMV